MSLLTIRYPSALPAPQRANVAPVERRALGTSDKPRDARALARDRLARVSVTFPPMREAAFAAFRDWWRDDLVLGSKWFVADWPNMQGAATKVYRFTAPPRWSFVPGGLWSITAELEIRGEGMDPVRAPAALMLCHFDGSTLEEVTGESFSGVPSSYASAPGGFGEEAVFSGQGLEHRRPGVNFLDNDPWQIDAWITLDDPLARSYKTVFELGSYNGTTLRLMILIGVASGSTEVQCSVYNSAAPGGGGLQALEPIALNSNRISETERTHLRLVREGAELRQYHDGILVASETDPYSFNASDTFSDERAFFGGSASNLLTPGGSIAGFAAYYFGRIDEVRFATELTDAAGSFTPPSRPFNL